VHSSRCRSITPHTITHRPSKRKASPGSQLLSEKRGKRPQDHIPVVGRNTDNASTSAAASIQDVQDVTSDSVIEEFTDVMAETPVTKRVSRIKPHATRQETSIVTTPGSTDARPRSRSGTSVIRAKSSVTATAKQSATRKKNAKAKPELVTPTEFARRLHEQASIAVPLPRTTDLGGREARQPSTKLPVKIIQPPQYLKDYVLFYTGGDLTYASARTRGCMNYVCVFLSSFLHTSTYKECTQIHKHGGTVLPKFDPATATHIVTETNEKNTLRALGLKTLSEIPLEIPTVYWSWVISGKSIPGEKDKQQMDYEFMHAAFPSRVDAGRPLAGKGKGKQKLAVGAGQASILQPGETLCVVTAPHFLSPDELYAHSPCALAHERLLPTHHQVDHLAESMKRSQDCTGRHLRCAKEGMEWFACFMPSSTLRLVTKWIGCWP
jgi:hypothetical protein